VVKVLLQSDRERDKLKIPMYLILVYDVGQKRVGKVCKTLRKHLNWVQNSVFEGEVSEADLRKIQMEIEPIVELDEDSLMFYCINNPKGWHKMVLGQEKLSTDTFL
jgi:CRISPR-associated protein Cas2